MLESICLANCSGAGMMEHTDAGRYMTPSDMYQFGKVLEEFDSLLVSVEGKDFVTKLKGKKMGAKKALEHA